MSQLFLFGGGVTSHSILEDLSWVLAYSKKGWLEPFQGNRAMTLARTLRGGAGGCKTLVQRPLEAVGGSSTPIGVVLYSLPFSSSRDRLLVLSARVGSHGRVQSSWSCSCTLRLCYASYRQLAAAAKKWYVCISCLERANDRRKHEANYRQL